MISGFKNRGAYCEFRSGIKRLESEIIKNAATDYSDRINIYTDYETGQILMWFKENDPFVKLLDKYYLHLFHKIVWRMDRARKERKRGDGTKCREERRSAQRH